MVVLACSFHHGHVAVLWSNLKFNYPYSGYEFHHLLKKLIDMNEHEFQGNK